MSEIPLTRDFDISHQDDSCILVVFRPTNTQYLFTIVTDAAERTGISLITADSKDRVIGRGYVAAEVLEIARRLAFVAAERNTSLLVTQQSNEELSTSPTLPNTIAINAIPPGDML